MNLILTNPWGLLALLGIPLLILIYYLRRKAQVVTVSTLFLLKRTQRESKAGKRFETFSNSLPFWLQVLAILLLTWILVQPRYGNHRVTQQIAIVVDSSASMQPLRGVIAEKLRSHLSQMKGTADHASYIVIDHDPRRPRMYQGDDAGALLDRFDNWNPTDGALDPTPALRIARSLVGPGGVVVYLTDHDGPNLPLSSYRLALGEGKVNCGFTGVTVEKDAEGFFWSAIVRNYSDSPQTREWFLETLDRQRSDPLTVKLPARRFTTLRGRFPEGQERCVVRLSGDSLPLDDALPIVVNRPRVARLSVTGGDDLVTLGQRMVRGFSHLERAEIAANSDLLLGSISSGAEALSEKPLVAFYQGGSGERPKGRLLVEEHALTTGLNFQALSLASMEVLKPRSDDQSLVWFDDQPLIVLRRSPESRAEQLVFAFSLSDSNAAKLPAIAVLLHRFCEKVARETLSAHTAAFETSQLLSKEFPKSVAREDLALAAMNLSGESELIPLKTGFRVTQRASPTPGFLSLSYQGEPLLDAAVQFADTREADLSQATSTSLPDFKSALAERRTSEDRFWRWVALGLVVLVLAAWHFLNPTTKAK
jgi:hypothetical protein